MAEAKIKDLGSLTPSLKKLIHAPFSNPNTTPAPPHIRNIYQRLSREAKERRYGERPWITIAAAATFTLNSPQSLTALHSVASSTSNPLLLAELIRETGLKSISFNGIPRTINCLNAFRSDLEINPWSPSLSTSPSRTVTNRTINDTVARGNSLWKSIYTPYHNKLSQKLALAHPDLPGYILQGHYAMLLSDPPQGQNDKGAVPKQARLGRCLTSLVAIACLRAQTGVGPQVLSHVYGLKKAIAQELHKTEDEFDIDGQEAKEGIERLAEDEGCEWVLNSVDAIAKAIGGGNFAQWEREEPPREQEGEEEGVEDDTRLDGEVTEVSETENVAREMQGELDGEKVKAKL
ncbi:hypothetical protein B0T21DRAFT_295047 [Apiosordaria backusii]|uniref:Dol-P-Man:Man(5)GlcNAc(2)-PP-Dol alpha-1,3-mannosyltransferase n=1 Tax=Apiosordaria backusii TaxID=314023 RepID=A0AA40AST3_9PEZI|nr:hypothetical protein B0T21DRAFT_295047 [Apiosordaria backusii]